MEKILIWGTGHFIEIYNDKIQQIIDGDKFSLIAFIDNDISKAGMTLMNRSIIHPDEIQHIQFDELVIATSKESYSSIKQQAIEKLGIEENRIHSFTWLITAGSKGKVCGELTKNKIKKRVFDCFSFYNELDILELRLELLKDVVDRFVLVELPMTHRWVEKPLFFDENRKRFERYKDKIIYVCSADLPAKPDDSYLNWTLENFQRNSVLRGLDGIATEEDLIMVSDVDEIPNPVRVREMKEDSWRLDYDVFSFKQKFFYYYFDFCHKLYWNGTFISKYKNLGTPQNWRNICGFLPEIQEGGWHLSYFGGAERIGAKISSTVDSAEFNVTEEEIEKRILQGTDIFGRQGEEFDIDKVDYIDLDIPDISSIREKYPHFFLQKWS